MKGKKMLIEKQIECVKREIGMRERVYPRWVEVKKMSQQKADEEIETMKQVLKTLETIKNVNDFPACMWSGDCEDCECFEKCIWFEVAKLQGKIK